jgi:uncharacterized protein (TIGR03435 family)
MKTTFITAIFCALLHGQSTPPATTPKFDVVSVKPCIPGVSNGGDSPGRISGCLLLADTDNTGAIQRAYNRYAGGHVNSFRIIPIEGGPEWIHSERFEIDARSEAHPTTEMMEGPMMQALLEDRFKLKIHRETRQGPVYDLTLGKGAPKLKPYQEGSCIPVVAGRPRPVLADGQKYCRNMANARGGVDMEGGNLTAFIGLLGMVVDRPVIDKTGLTGQFEIHVKFSLENPAAAGAAVPDLPDLFQAIQDQVGLKLVPAKGPVDVLVIDHIERPTGN